MMILLATDCIYIYLSDHTYVSMGKTEVFSHTTAQSFSSGNCIGSSEKSQLVVANS